MTNGRDVAPTQLDEDGIWKLELTEVAELIRTRQLTSEEVTDSTLRRIEKFDPQLRSYAFVMADSALKAARAADADIAHGHCRGVLHGRRPHCGGHHHPSRFSAALRRYGCREAARCRRCDHWQVSHDGGGVSRLSPESSDTGQSLGPSNVGRRVLERLRRGHRSGIVLRLGRVRYRGIDPISDEHVRRHRDQTDVGPGQPARNH